MAQAGQSSYREVMPLMLARYCAFTRFSFAPEAEASRRAVLCRHSLFRPLVYWSVEIGPKKFYAGDFRVTGNLQDLGFLRQVR